MSYFKHQQNYQLCIYSKSCCECYFVQLEIQVLPTQLEVRILKIRLVNPYAQTNCRCDNFCALGCQRILECEWGCLSNLSHVHYTFFYHKIFSKFCKKKKWRSFFKKKNCRCKRQCGYKRQILSKYVDVAENLCTLTVCAQFKPCFFLRFDDIKCQQPIEQVLEGQEISTKEVFIRAYLSFQNPYMYLGRTWNIPNTWDGLKLERTFSYKSS